MGKKQFFAILDSETCIDDTVADLGIVICDKQGNIHASMGVLVRGCFDEKELFYNPNDTGFWGKQAATRRKAHYVEMLNVGKRMLATVPAINIWIAKAIAKYDPELTAYNLAFDTDKCNKTNIDLTGFKNSFCLWHAAAGNICRTKAYREFVVQNHLFNNVTQNQNMTYKTNAEAVCGFINGEFLEEPHTALEDAQFFELPILKHLLQKRNWRDKIEPYNWRNFQVKDSFSAK